MALSTNLGYPRIGKNREFKKSIEAFWKGGISETQLLADLEKIHIENLSTQISAGLDFTPVGDFSAYDLMLETALMLGVVPARFRNLSGWQRYYAMARGTQDLTACEMKKWFDSNYHYIMPEIEGGFQLAGNRVTMLYQWAASQFPGKQFRPVLIGPFTFLKLSRIKNGKSLSENLKLLAPVYQQIVRETASAGAQWLQIDEPALCGGVTAEEWKTTAESYKTLAADKRGLKIILQTYYGDVAEILGDLWKLPVDGVGLDLVRGPKNIEALRKTSVPAGKWVGLGITDGRNVWRTRLEETLARAEELTAKLDKTHVWIHPSCSLLHLPISLESEQHIPTVLKRRLAFAQDRLGETALLTRALNGGRETIAAELKTNNCIWKDQEFANFAFHPEVSRRVEKLSAKDFRRPSSFEKRYAAQQKSLNLPPLPTTTIGSFPQTAEIRQARARWKKGEITAQQYDAFIRDEIQKVVRLQEELGLDVLVHGEPERTDMVEFFAEQMKGFQFTKNGWVQSYGTRCVRAPIIYGDVLRERPMTVKEAKTAQSFTKKPMKGMLTGPVTILNWSFPRADVPKKTTAFQLALALRDEVADLEAAGIAVIQIDEPALREGLPLRKSDWAAYLSWAVEAFKLCSSGVADTTQIHTHMCYSEFSDILESIQALDADVLSIEDSRSAGRLAKGLAQMNYRNGIGPGIYDVHSERVPPKEDLAKTIRFLVDNIPLKQLWINPDCGLKTRGYKETTPSLKNLVDAVKEVREEL